MSNMDRLKEFLEDYKEKLIIALCMVLVAGIAYALGFIAARESYSRGVTITETELPPLFLESVSPTKTPVGEIRKTEGAFVASKKGKNYYPADCPVRKTLSLANLIFFDTFEEAESKGYKLSTRC